MCHRVPACFRNSEFQGDTGVPPVSAMHRRDARATPLYASSPAIFRLLAYNTNSFAPCFCLGQSSIILIPLPPMEREGQPWNRCFGRSFSRVLCLLLIAVILIAPAARAEITHQHVKDYVRKTRVITPFFALLFKRHYPGLAR